MYNSDCIVSSIKRRRFDLYNTYNHFITNLVGIIQFPRRENYIIRKVFVLNYVDESFSISWPIISHEDAIRYNYRSIHNATKTPVDNGPRSSRIDLEPVVSRLGPINQREKQFKPVQRERERVRSS